MGNQVMALVIAGQSEGHGLTLVDLSSKPGEAHGGAATDGHRIRRCHTFASFGCP